MIKQFFLVCFLYLLCTKLNAQQVSLPLLNIKSIGSKVIVSWKQDYKKVITTLNIQRSYDSLKNFNTIGEVLSPQSIENGYIDANPQYNRMYYRIFVAFEGGTYEYSKTYRAKKDTSTQTRMTSDNANLFPITNANQNYPWLNDKLKNDNSNLEDKNKITYPSQRIYTLKDNNILITLPSSNTAKYTIKFYDDADKFLFEIKKIKEDNFIIEKVNFGHSGWFKFEIYDNGALLESNKFQILKPLKGL